LQKGKAKHSVERNSKEEKAKTNEVIPEDETLIKDLADEINFQVRFHQ
jgi:hypothetical protein